MATYQELQELQQAMEDARNEHGSETDRAFIDNALNNTGGESSHPKGWKDNLAFFSNGKTNAATEPLWADIGNGIFAYQFADNKNNEIFVSFHTNHDIIVNSKQYPHIHWCPLSSHTGNIVWKLEYSLAKGHGQDESLTVPLNTIYIEQAGKGLIGEHMIAESTELNTITIEEPDMLLLIKITRESSHVNDTFEGSVAGFMCDLHYESDRETTINKTPNFYTTV